MIAVVDPCRTLSTPFGLSPVRFLGTASRTALGSAEHARGSQKYADEFESERGVRAKAEAVLARHEERDGEREEEETRGGEGCNTGRRSPGCSGRRCSSER